MWVAEIRMAGSAPEPGVPQSLFTLGGNPTTALNAHVRYNRFAVTADGQRFLMTQPGDATNVVAEASRTRLQTWPIRAALLLGRVSPAAPSPSSSTGRG